MFIRKISLDEYKVLKNIFINFEEKQNHRIFPIISINGGGKSTLLQFIFAFLHCAFEDNRHLYLKTLLENITNKNDIQKLNRIVKFELEHEDNVINLEFFHCKNNYNNLSFNSIITLQELKEKKSLNHQNIKNIELLNNLENDLSNSKISSSLVWRELRNFIGSRREEETLRRSDTSYTLSFIRRTRKDIENLLISDDEFNTLIIKADAERNNLLKKLEQLNLHYAFHYDNNKQVLLYNSNTKKENLIDISNKVYLATPNTQVLHFLNKEQLTSLFTNEKYVYSSYEHHIKECQENLHGLFTYDFSAINLILEAFKKARDDDFSKAIETGKYGEQIQRTRKELDNLLSGKSITIDNNFKGVKFKNKKNNVNLNPKDLSHGELKKLSIYIWLKAKTTDNSVILMDEVDMGLHPTWQYELYDDLQKWSEKNQFILATHSPQIISKSYYKNLVVIKQTSNGATTEQFNEAPLESDLNTIVKTIMGGDYIPKELAELRKKYRKLFEKKQLDTDEASKIKKQILNYESENSSFFQDIKFQMELQ